jgi:SAM-dependent methyltransferase
MPDPTKQEQARQRIREMSHQMLPHATMADYFDAIYTTAEGATENIPWADLQPHPLSVEWLQTYNVQGQGRRALVVGCGLGDDAEELARRGFQVTAFDVSQRAVAWCQERFPQSSVTYQVADLLDPHTAFQQAFDFILEIYTIQALPPHLHPAAIANIASFLASGGQLLVIGRAREPEEEVTQQPARLTRDELASFQEVGLQELVVEDLPGYPEGRHWRAEFTR